MTSDALKDQVLLVTGGGRRLGRSVAIKAAELGASVCVNVRENVAEAEAVVAEVQAQGARAIFAVGDVADAERVNQMVAKCNEELGPVTSVVHCAAYRSHHPLVEFSYEEWKKTMGVNIGGAHNLVRATLSPMIVAGFGRYVFLGGSVIRQGLPVGTTAGGAAKSAVRGLVRALTQEVAAHGIVANMLSPGLINFGDTVVQLQTRGWNPVTASALGRMASVEDLATACVSLCTPGASIFQGETMYADGGMYGFGE